MTRDFVLRSGVRLFSIVLSLAAFAFNAAAEPSWPQLGQPPAVGGGEKDAALIVGIERYGFVPAIDGAARNAEDWYQYLTRGLGVPAKSVVLLRDNEGTAEKLRRFAAETAHRVQPGGTLWFVFIGHGAPAKDGKDGILVGYDTQQDADSLYARGVPQRELLAALKLGPQARTVAVLDACFSGRTSSGELVHGLQPLSFVRVGAPEDKLLVFTAGHSDQFAGPLPGAARPAFSYLVLGALRGWADRNGDGRITAQEVVDYSNEALRSLVKDRQQTPELIAAQPGAVLASAREPGPDLGALALRSTPSVAPAGKWGDMPALPSELRSGGAVTLGVDADALVAYDAALAADQRGKQSPDDAAAAWGKLAAMESGNPYRARAAERQQQWIEFGRQKRALEAQREIDRERLRKVLPLASLDRAQKASLLAQFASAYGVSEMIPLIADVRPSQDRAELCRPHLRSGVGDRIAVTAERALSKGSSDADARKRIDARILVDGEEIGHAPSTVVVPTCASRLGVSEVAGGGWQEFALPASRVTATFAQFVAANGVVRDLETGLSWEQFPSEDLTTWNQARAHCRGVDLGGGGWRMPTEAEFMTIVSWHGDSNPPFDDRFFARGHRALYWIVVPKCSGGWCGHYVRLGDEGYQSSKGGDQDDGGAFVRCVR
jgi:Protein of unknown function (DUF1566)